MNQIPYRKPQLGRDYWIKERVLPNARRSPSAVCRARTGCSAIPMPAQAWPGKRSRNALSPEELAPIEQWVLKQTGVSRLYQEASPGTVSSITTPRSWSARCESRSMPHTDSKDCRFAGVLYLNEGAPKTGRYLVLSPEAPDGSLGGNQCPPQHASLREALGVPTLPMSAWKEDWPYATCSTGWSSIVATWFTPLPPISAAEHRSKRLTLVFFWRAS